MIMTVPERWQEVIDLVLAPIAWIPRMQEALIAFFVSPAARWTSPMSISASARCGNITCRRTSPAWRPVLRR
jgi:hypothetical protein